MAEKVFNSYASNGSVSKEWQACLVRQLTLVIRSIFDHAAAQCQDSLDLNPLDQPSYVFSQSYFERKLAEVMMNFRRKAGDESQAITWSNYSSRMFRPVRNLPICMPHPMLIDIDLTSSIPAAPPAHPPVPLSIHGDLNFPFGHLLEENKISTTFHNQYMKASVVTLKVLTVRFVIFWNLCNPTVVLKKGDRDVYMNFRIKDDLYLHHFFHCWNHYWNYVYNQCSYIKKHFGQDFFQLDDSYEPKDKENNSLDYLALLNRRNWKTDHNHGNAPDYSSLFDYSDVLSAREKQIVEIIKEDLPMIDSNKNFDRLHKSINPAILVTEYFQRAHFLYVKDRKTYVESIQNQN